MSALVAAGAGLAGLAVPLYGPRLVLAPLLLVAGLLFWLAPVYAGVAVVATVIVGGWDVARVATPIPGLYLIDAAGLLAVGSLLLRYPWVWDRWRFGGWYLAFLAVCAVPLIFRLEGASAAYGLRALAFAYYPVFALLGLAAMAVPARRRMAWLIGIALCIALPSALLLGDTERVVLTTSGSRRYIGGIYGGFGAMALPLALFLLNRPLTRTHGVAVGVASLLLIVLSSHRSAWLAGLCALGAAWLMTRDRRISPTAVALGGIVIAVLGGAAALGALPIDTGAQLERAVSLVDSADDPNVQDRLERWRLAVNQVARGGFIGEGFFVDFPTPRTAVGPGAPHNIWVTVFFRAGLAGAVLYAALVVRSLITRDVNDEDRPLHAAIGGAVVGGLVFSTFNVTLENPYFAPVVWFAVGAALALREPAGQRAPVPPPRLLVRDGRIEQATERGFVGGDAHRLAINHDAGRAP